MMIKLASLLSIFSSADGAVAVSNASCLFSRPKKLIHLANVYCRGRENVIMECAAYTNTLSAGISVMREVDVAAVMCQVPNTPAPPTQPETPQPDLTTHRAAGASSSHAPVVHSAKEPSSTKVFCHSSTPVVVQPSSSIREQSRALTPAVYQSSTITAPSPSSSSVVPAQQQSTSSQQMMMVLQSSVVTAVFMGLIFLMLLLLMGR